MSSDDPADEPEEKGILAPDELDISDHPKVESLSEGRYVVSAPAGGNTYKELKTPRRIFEDESYIL